MKVAINGASGFVGRAISEKFNDLIILKRTDSEKALVDKLQDVDVVINLAGAPIIKRWSPAYKKLLVSSRVETTRTLVKCINQTNVKHFISTSAIGIYPNDRACDEQCEEHANDFLADLIRAWEAEALACDKTTTILRYGIVLGARGGALAKMLLPFKLGLGGVIGKGAMKTSWIHIDDLLSIYDFVISQNLEGVFNATSPYPVTNLELSRSLAKSLYRPLLFSIPTFVFKLIYSEGASALIDSKEVFPYKLLQKGYQFKYERISTALNALFQK